MTLALPLGCVAVEFLIWHLGGRAGVEPERRTGWLGYITVSVAFLSLVVSVALGTPLDGGFIRLPLYVYVDELSVYFILLVNVVAFFSSWGVIHYMQARVKMNRDQPNPRRPLYFHGLFNFFHFTMLLVAMVDNLIVLWLAVEMTTLVSTLLVAYRGDRPAFEAAWKYIVITSTGIIFALLGTMFFAYALQSPGSGCADTPFNWSELNTAVSKCVLNTGYVKLSFVFILIGYGTKAGLAPMFTWLPDGHGQAPSPVSALLSGVLLKSALYAILRFYTLTNLSLSKSPGTSPQDAFFTSNLLLYTGLFSLALAVPFILKNNSFKRVLAYHSLEHMGIITFGLGIGGPIALYGALLHMLNHALTKSLMFLTFGLVRTKFNVRRATRGEPAVETSDIRGLLKSMPLTSGLLFFGGVALVGAPPFNIFLSEFFIFWGAVTDINQRFDAARVVALAIFILSVVLIFGGLVGHLARILLGHPPSADAHEEEKPRELLPLFLLLAMILYTGLSLFPLAGLLTRSVQIVQGGHAGD